MILNLKRYDETNVIQILKRGLIPLSYHSIEKAIELNNVAISFNIQAFHWGRQAAIDLQAVENAAGLKVEEKLYTTSSFSQARSNDRRIAEEIVWFLDDDGLQNSCKTQRIARNGF